MSARGPARRPRPGRAGRAGAAGTRTRADGGPLTR